MTGLVVSDVIGNGMVRLECIESSVLLTGSALNLWVGMF